MESQTHTTTPEIAKKQWITPKVEIISKDVIQVGTTPGTEGNTVGGTIFYSGS